MVYTSKNLIEYCIDAVRVLFTKESVPYYLTVTSDTYNKLFNREAVLCIAFKHQGELYYMYFNMSFYQPINSYEFTSVGIVSRESFKKKSATYEKKWHIETLDDAKQFLKDLKDVI